VVHFDETISDVEPAFAPPVSWQASPVTAQSPGENKPAADAFSAADNAWMLTSSALVLMMTAPGLALFYCGLYGRRTCSA